MTNKVFFMDNNYVYFGEIVATLYEVRFEDIDGSMRSKIIQENEIISEEKVDELLEVQRVRLETFIRKIQSVDLLAKPKEPSTDEA